MQFYERIHDPASNFYCNQFLLIYDEIAPNVAWNLILFNSNSTDIGQIPNVKL